MTRARDVHKRHIAVDAIGPLLTVLVTAAGVQDRDGARPLLWNLRRAFPKVKLAVRDGRCRPAQGCAQDCHAGAVHRLGNRPQPVH